ncbi:hypothetical protein B0T11DRAFT_318829 [Plectosphaerella cucumerina]|uniref:Zn(2)-C6 fungal-type domain-containing protein n=1 Tax=Plectosphaerella cucumerina TaxID=40658 RepID=A0A8K0TN42_9PEZI|nr:hypothetical protein B0T11DRAFT_318829 [Plectosphaerella cucumerina]
MPAQRSKTTCNQCRARKVRCDGGPPPCAGCKRLDFECSFDNTPASAPAAVPEKKRGSRACRQCRSLKSKCTGELPTCAGCRTSGKTCVYPELRRAARRQEASDSGAQNTGISPVIALETPESASIHAAPVSSRSSQHEPPPSGPSTAVSRIEPADAHPLPPLRDRLHLVVDFFRHIHPIPAYAFLYEEATVQRCLEETIDEALIYSICALSALLLGYSKYHPVATATWATRVENMIWASLEQPTIFKIQALALVIQYRIITGNFQRGFLVFSLAARSATALRLSYERTDLSPLAQEIRRRLMWSLVMLDGHFAIGLSECELAGRDF